MLSLSMGKPLPPLRPPWPRQAATIPSTPRRQVTARTPRVSPCWASTWHRASPRRAMVTVRGGWLTRRQTSNRCWLSHTLEATSSPGETQVTNNAAQADPGLESLVMLLHLQGVAADREQIKHRLGTTKIGAPEILRCAKDLGLKARACRSDWSRLAKTPLPAIAALRDGGFMVIAKAGEGKVLVQSPHRARRVLMTRAERLALGDGELFLMPRGAGLGEMTRRFDITWFMAAIYKYRRLLSEVLVASFFLQMFALVSPLFFQVVIDKVLV